ncbi:unnamed protein product [Heligmosomoides polygyrus]|uniref:ULP_PROTEASE domain-containing protein n=1 Tax=Heligmosomoides polygyrus TaxID=6339 RepID=A0A183GGT2_HELPZ|nr:unnamed protein product [Heligmosomoides polygyrus]
MNSHDDSADTSVIDFYGILGRLRLQYAEQETSTDNHINETPMSDFKEIVVKKSRQNIDGNLPMPAIVNGNCLLTAVSALMLWNTDAVKQKSYDYVEQRFLKRLRESS